MQPIDPLSTSCPASVRSGSRRVPPATCTSPTGSARPGDSPRRRGAHGTSFPPSRLGCAWSGDRAIPADAQNDAGSRPTRVGRASSCTAQRGSPTLIEDASKYWPESQLPGEVVAERGIDAATAGDFIDGPHSADGEALAELDFIEGAERGKVPLNWRASSMAATSLERNG